MAETITHAFVSTKAESPDTTLVSTSEWNDGHVFSGGVNGQKLVYDNTQPNNMRWSDGRSVGEASVTVSSSTATPIVGAASVVKTVNSNSAGLATVTVLTFTTVGAAAGTVEIQLNGVTIVSLNLISGPITFTFPVATSTTAGTRTYSLRFTTVGAVNILTLFAQLTVDLAGI